MLALTLTVSKIYSNELKELRKTCYYYNSAEEPIDEFDIISNYLCIFNNNELIASARITESNPSVWQKWVCNNIKIPLEKGICNYSRACIDSNYRGQGLFNILQIEMLKYCIDRNIQKIMCATENEIYKINNFKSFYYDLYEKPFLGKNEPTGIVQGQFYICNIVKQKNNIISIREKILNSFKEKGNSIKLIDNYASI